jgi:ribonuclease Y
VPLPNDEMKGRIIGREGRNIRALENAHRRGSDHRRHPEAITLSGFDPVRREIARLRWKAPRRRRFHPARIEDNGGKIAQEVELTIKQEGERATFETGVHGIHPEMVRLLGKLRFRTSYGQNV